MCRFLTCLNSLFRSPSAPPNRLRDADERRVYRMGSLSIEAETKDEALRQAAKAVFEGYEAPLDEMHGAWTDMDVFDALIRGDFER